MNKNKVFRMNFEIQIAGEIVKKVKEVVYMDEVPHLVLSWRTDVKGKKEADRCYKLEEKYIHHHYGNDTNGNYILPGNEPFKIFQKEEELQTWLQT